MKLAQQENFALFVLSGMLSNLHNVHKLIPTETNILREHIQSSIHSIKSAQWQRKLKRKQNETK